MRALALVPLLLPVLGGAPALSDAQTRRRKVMLTGTVRTIPSGTRFALGTKLGTFSVETRSAKFVMSGKAANFADLRLGSSMTVLGTLLPASGTTRATIVATRVEIAPPPVAGTKRRSTASTRS